MTEWEHGIILFMIVIPPVYTGIFLPQVKARLHFSCQESWQYFAYQNRVKLF